MNIIQKIVLEILLWLILTSEVNKLTFQELWYLHLENSNEISLYCYFFGTGRKQLLMYSANDFVVYWNVFVKIIPIYCGAWKAKTYNKRSSLLLS